MARIAVAVLLGAASVDAALLVDRRGGSISAARKDLGSYSFARFARDFDRNYLAGSQEFRHRSSIFQASIAEARSVNARNAEQGRAWTAGVHPFMDWTEQERKSLNGYKPSRRKQGSSSVGLSAIQTNSRIALNSTFDGDSPSAGNSPSTQGPALRYQGSCGSCWAIATVEAVEAQLIRNGQDASSLKLSPQALVDCTPNEKHCGGTGGCDGATGELGLAFIRDHGIPMEDELSYTAETGQCEMQQRDGPWPGSGKRARVSGWRTLPSNQGSTQLMQAIVEQGPAIVAVDANNWHYYQGGIFDGCEKDAILGHAVLAKGYGEENGQKYWHIQNSWGRHWGEHGHIRMLRHEDEDSWCGTDSKPEDGLGCEGGPSSVEVCGMCGILYDPIIPQGVRLEDGGQSQTTAASSADPTVAAAFGAIDGTPIADTLTPDAVSSTADAILSTTPAADMITPPDSSTTFAADLFVLPDGASVAASTTAAAASVTAAERDPFDIVAADAAADSSSNEEERVRKSLLGLN